MGRNVEKMVMKSSRWRGK